MTERTEIEQEDGDEAARELAALARLAAHREERGEQRRTYRHSDFLFDTSQDAFWCLPSGALLSAISVNALIPVELWRIPMRDNPNGRGRPPAPIPPARDIARIESGTIVEGSTWMPGAPEVINDMFASKDGLMPLPGARLYNNYKAPPKPDPAKASEAGPWVEHVKRLYPEPEEHEFFFDYCAHMIQRPGEKSNAGLILSGKQGIGKDALLLPLRRAVGEWNCSNVGPDDILDKWTPWVASVMLIVDEVRPMSDDHRATSLYEAMKTLAADPPKVLALKDKNLRTRYVANVLRIFMTTNDRLAFYLPPEDRRFLILDSNLQQKWHEAAGDPDYFVRLFEWVERGGAEAVAAFLATRDISGYLPKAGPPKTESWAEITQRWDAPEDELTQALEMLGEPDVVLSSELTEQLFDGAEGLRKMMKGRGFVFRMQQAGYRLVPLPAGQRKWRKELGGFEVQSNKAYIKDSARLSAKSSVEAVWARVDERLAAGPGGTIPKRSRLNLVK